MTNRRNIVDEFSRQAGALGRTRIGHALGHRHAVVETLETRRLLAADMVTDVFSGGSGSDPSQLTATSNGLFFAATTDSGRRLFFSDGTADGTTLLPAANPGQLTAAEDRVFFTSNGTLYTSDGTAQGTTPIKKLDAGVLARNSIGQQFYFFDLGGADQTLRLWKSSGTSDTTVLVTTFPERNVSEAIVADGAIYFSATKGSIISDGGSLYRSDGTAAGTKRLGGYTGGPYNLTAYNGRVYFGAGGNTTPVRLWSTDGTIPGTRLFNDSTGASFAGAMPVRASAGKLYFSVNTGFGNYDLWKTDGTPSGTAKLGIVAFGAQPGTVAGSGQVLYIAFDELLATDGVAGSNAIRLVKDINTEPDPGRGTVASRPSFLTDVNGILYFTADEPENGRELWKSDGTEPGTTLVQDINPGPNGSSPSDLTAVGGTLFFKASTPGNGSELWKLPTTASAPLGVRAVATSKSRIEIRWAYSGSAATGFRVERSTGGSGFVPVATLNDPLVRSFADTNGLSPDTRYTYRIVGIAAFGNSLPSGPASATTQPAIPRSPDALTAVPHAGSTTVIDLSWTDRSGDEAGYRVERRQHANQDDWRAVAVLPADSTSYRDEGLASSTSYAYRVRAFNDSGESAFSNEIVATTRMPQLSFGAAPANVPGRIEAEEFDRGSNTIAYQDLSPQSTGDLYRSDTDVDFVALPDGGHAVDADDPGEWLEYTVDVSEPGLRRVAVKLASATGGGSFHVEVDGVDKTGQIEVVSTGNDNAYRWMNIGNINLTAGSHVLRLSFDAAGSDERVAYVDTLYFAPGSLGPPSSPVELAASPLGREQVDLSWRNISADTFGFVIERRVGSSDKWEQIAIAPEDATTCADTGVLPLTHYSYRIKAYNPAGESAFGPEAGVLTLEAGTSIVRDIIEGPEGSAPQQITEVDGHVIFWTLNGAEVWSSGGTAETTVKLAGIFPTFGYIPTVLKQGNVAYFTAPATYNANSPVHVYRTDGTPAGTIDIGLSSGLSQPVLSGGSVYFFNEGLYKANPNAVAADLLVSLPANGFVWIADADGKLFFLRQLDGRNEYQLWTSDGTADGTKLVAPVPALFNPRYPAIGHAGKTLLFRTESGLWRSDGTPEGTYSLGNIPSSTFVSLGDRALFTYGTAETGGEPWITDGTVDGTALLQDVNPGPESSNVVFGIEYGGKFFFTATSAKSGREVWTTDGTSDGTTLFLDIERGSSGSSPGYWTRSRNWLYFATTEGVEPSLWRTNGNAQNTVRVASIPFNSTRDAPLRGLVADGAGGIYFQTVEAVKRFLDGKIWHSAGTPGDAVLVADPTPESTGYAVSIEQLGGALFYDRYTAEFGDELWKAYARPTSSVLLATALSSSQVGLRWSVPTGGIVAPLGAPIAGYRIERKDAADGAWVRIADVGADVLSYTDQGLAAGTRYSYRVRAVSAGGDTPSASVDVTPVGVIGRYAFYNNSRFDGTNTAINSADDEAIASDKSALLPGQTPTFANVTSYAKGLNGVMIDVAGLPASAILTADDFIFRATHNLSSVNFIAGPVPASVELRRGQGVNGSDRIVLVWTDATAGATSPARAVMNGWLEVTLRPGANTGLATSEVFRFGNLIGETGDHPVTLAVTAADLVRVRNALGKVASVASACDFDRNGVVNALDLVVVRNRVGTSLPVAAPPATAFSSQIIAPAGRKWEADLYRYSH